MKAALAMQSVERFRTFLREKSLRATTVREAIVKAVVVRKGHFHIDELVRDLRVRGVNASRATVYRVLPLLVEAGLIQPTILSGNGHYYETAVGHEHHDHLVCSECDKVVEFRFEAFEILQREVAAKHGFELTSHFHELIGICPECRGRRRAPGS
jgi:Fur family ferric uptake transcriptional regulator